MIVRAVAVLALVGIGSCSTTGDDDGGTEERLGTTEAPGTTGPTVSEPGGEEAVVPGRAIVASGSERFDFVVFECLVGQAETGSPSRRLALSASLTEPFLDAGVVLNVDVIVSEVSREEEHRMTITRLDGSGPDLGAADVSLPSSGGSAPNDWITVDEAARTVRGAGFELRPLSASGGDADTLPPGELVADCP